MHCACSETLTITTSIHRSTPKQALYTVRIFKSIIECDLLNLKQASTKIEFARVAEERFDQSLASSTIRHVVVFNLPELARPHAVQLDYFHLEAH